MTSLASSASMSRNSGCREIPGFAKYFATEDGEVFSKDYNNTGIAKALIGKTTKDGYIELLLRDNDGNRKYIRKHIIIALAIIPNPSNLPQVNHQDGNKFNCKPSNLQWCTQSDNICHGYNTGLYSRKSQIIAINIITGEKQKNMTVYTLQVVQ